MQCNIYIYIYIYIYILYLYVYILKQVRNNSLNCTRANSLWEDSKEPSTEWNKQINKTRNEIPMKM